MIDTECCVGGRKSILSDLIRCQVSHCECDNVGKRRQIDTIIPHIIIIHTHNVHVRCVGFKIYLSTLNHYIHQTKSHFNCLNGYVDRGDERESRKLFPVHQFLTTPLTSTPPATPATPYLYYPACEWVAGWFSGITIGVYVMEMEAGLAKRNHFIVCSSSFIPHGPWVYNAKRGVWEKVLVHHLAIHSIYSRIISSVWSFL